MCEYLSYIFVSVKVTFTDRDGDEVTVDAKIGDSLLEVAKEYDIDLEGIRFSTSSHTTSIILLLKSFNIVQ